MSSQNNRLNPKRKRKKRYVTYDGQTIWDNRNPGETPLFARPDWMAVPKEIIARDHGPRKRRIIRQFMSPCPLTGNLVPCRELEPGSVFCWESPGKGFLFGFSENIDPDVQVIDGGVGPD